MKMHVLVRKDLPWSHKAVQAAHATAEYVMCHDVRGWNGTLVIHRVKDETELRHYYDKLWTSVLNVALFKEPDMYNQATALAFLGHDDIVSELSLL